MVIYLWFAMANSRCGITVFSSETCASVVTDILFVRMLVIRTGAPREGYFTMLTGPSFLTFTVLVLLVMMMMISFSRTVPRRKGNQRLQAIVTKRMACNRGRLSLSTRTTILAREIAYSC